MTTPVATTPLRFGRFELQVDERRLCLDGEAVPLGGRAFDLLVALAERPGRLVSKHALMDLVWPGLVVQENNLAAQISTLRKVVGGEVIATIPGRGYRFVAPVAPVAPIDAGARQGMPSPSTLPPAATTGASGPGPRTNLPAELPALHGRGEDLQALGRLIDDHRLVSVVGAGGIGKSLLLKHLLAARRHAYPQGVCWVELSEVDDEALLPATIAAALGIDLGPGAALPALIAAAAPLTLLLALDNAEHLLTGVADLCRALHDAAPGLRVAVASQAPLRLAAERVLRIGPLGLPPGAMPAPQALDYGAVALFVDRALAVDHRFRLTDADTHAVIETCRALDGVPLAIELAAARAPVLGMTRLLSSMQSRLKVLTVNRDRAAPARQQTLESALAWSCGLLPAREQQVFRGLSVMAGSASLDFILQVLVDDGGALDAWGVVDALDTLVDRSLLTVLTPDEDREPRYRLLESPRAYASACLDAAGERPDLQRRHARALAASFDRAYDECFSGRIGEDDWLRQRELDFDNAREALRWARGTDEAEIELRISATLLRALPTSCHAERLALVDTCEARIGARVPDDLLLRVWLESSRVLANSQKPRGRMAAERALALARQCQARATDSFTLYHALARCATAAAQTGDLPSARARLRELQALEDPAWPAQRLVWGTEAAQWVARVDGDALDVLRRGRRLLALDRERGSHAAIAAVNLVESELAAGNARAAVQLGTELIDALHGTRHECTLAYAGIALVAALLAQDDTERAGAAARMAWQRASQFGLQHTATAHLALLCALQGRPDDAMRLLGYSESLYASRGEARERNEFAAMQRARALAGPALDDAARHRLQAEGARMREADVPAVAFGAGDRH